MAELMKYYPDLETYQNLLDHGANIFAKDLVGNTPLHYAALYGNLELAQLLLDHGALINSNNRCDATPLMCTTTPEIAQLLLDRGARMDDDILIKYLMANFDQQDTNMVEFWLDQGIDVTYLDIHGYSALHFATHLNVIELLVQVGCPMSKNRSGNNPLMSYVTTYDDIEIVKYYIDILGLCTNRRGQSLLHLTSHPCVLEYLLDYHGDCFDLDDISILETHIQENRLDNVKLLLQTKNWDLNELLPSVNSLEMLKLLLEYGVNLHAFDDNHETVLFYYGDSVEMLEYCLNQGVNPNHLNYDQLSALAHILSQKTGPVTDIIQLFIDRGYDCSNCLIIPHVSNPQDAKYLLEAGAHPDQLYSNEQVFQQLLRDPIYVQWLLDSGLTVVLQTESGNGILHLCHNLDSIKLLVEHGANIYALNMQDENVLFYQRKPEIVRYYLELGINPNQEDFFERTVIISTTNWDVVYQYIMAGCRYPDHDGPCNILKKLVRDDEVDKIRILLRAGYGCRPYPHYFSMVRSLQMAELLIGIWPNCLAPLHSYLLLQQDMEIIRFLIPHTNLQYINSMRRGVIDLAKTVDIVQLLLEHGAPIHRHVFSQHIHNERYDIIKYLLNRGHRLPNQAMRHARTWNMANFLWKNGVKQMAPLEVVYSEVQKFILLKCPDHVLQASAPYHPLAWKLLFWRRQFRDWLVLWNNYQSHQWVVQKSHKRRKLTHQESCPLLNLPLEVFSQILHLNRPI